MLESPIVYIHNSVHDQQTPHKAVATQVYGIGL